MVKVLRQYYSLRNILFFFIESFLIFFSIFATLLLFVPEKEISPNNFFLFKFAVIITMFVQTSIYYADLYEIKNVISPKSFFVGITKAFILICFLLGIYYLLLPPNIISFKVQAICFSTVLVIIGSYRYCCSFVFKKGLFNQRIILIGQGDIAKKIITEIKERDDCGYEITHIVLNNAPENFFFDTEIPVVSDGNYQGLSRLAEENKIRKVVVAIEEKRGNFPSEELLKCRVYGIEVLEGNSFYEMLSGKLVVDQLYPSWLIFSDGFQKSLVNSIFKRTFDIAVSFAMMVVCLPLMIIAGILIKIDSRGPVFYSQERVGRNHKTYNIYKLRSMIDNAEETCGPQCACENDPRITRVGYFLRKFRIDELPQLWNVMKGEMSFVGPRPERACFVEEYEKKIPYYVERFSIKPGITGWAQIRYQYCANEEETLEKINYDLFYIKNMSILMDIIIFMRTVKIVVFGQGAR